MSWCGTVRRSALRTPPAVSLADRKEPAKEFSETELRAKLQWVIPLSQPTIYGWDGREYMIADGRCGVITCLLCSVTCSSTLRSISKLISKQFTWVGTFSHDFSFHHLTSSRNGITMVLQIIYQSLAIILWSYRVNPNTYV